MNELESLFIPPRESIKDKRIAKTDNIYLTTGKIDGKLYKLLDERDWVKYRVQDEVEDANDATFKESLTNLLHSIHGGPQKSKKSSQQFSVPHFGTSNKANKIQKRAWDKDILSGTASKNRTVSKMLANSVKSEEASNVKYVKVATAVDIMKQKYEANLKIMNQLYDEKVTLEKQFGVNSNQETEFEIPPPDFATLLEIEDNVPEINDVTAVEEDVEGMGGGRHGKLVGLESYYLTRTAFEEQRREKQRLEELKREEEKKLLLRRPKSASKSGRKGPKPDQKVDEPDAKQGNEPAAEGEEGKDDGEDGCDEPAAEADAAKKAVTTPAATAVSVRELTEMEKHELMQRQKRAERKAKEDAKLAAAEKAAKEERKAKFQQNMDHAKALKEEKIGWKELQEAREKKRQEDKAKRKEELVKMLSESQFEAAAPIKKRPVAVQEPTFKPKLSGLDPDTVSANLKKKHDEWQEATNRRKEEVSKSREASARSAKDEAVIAAMEGSMKRQEEKRLERVRAQQEREATEEAAKKAQEQEKFKKLTSAVLPEAKPTNSVMARNAKVKADNERDTPPVVRKTATVKAKNAVAKKEETNS